MKSCPKHPEFRDGKCYYCNGEREKRKCLSLRAAERLKNERLKRGLSQKEMGKILGVSGPRLLMLEKRCNCSVMLAIQFSDRLGIKLKDFLK